jgi:hypothetical protein
MKFLLVLAFLTGCTQKYADYDLIRKADFNRQSFERPVTRTQALPTGKDELENCFNQWLFFSNAEKEKDEAIPNLVRALCPREAYLMDTHMTETWWTTIVFSRSCVDIQTSCADEKR